MSSARSPVDYSAQMQARRASLAAETPALTTPPPPAVEALLTADTPIGLLAEAAVEDATANGLVPVVPKLMIAVGAPAVPDVAVEQVLPVDTAVAVPVAMVPVRTDRQGIDLRPVDRGRIDNFEMFCLKNRVKTGKKTGLSLYARAGFQVLTTMMESDPVGFRALLVRVGEEKR